MLVSVLVVGVVIALVHARLLVALALPPVGCIAIARHRSPLAVLS